MEWTASLQGIFKEISLISAVEEQQMTEAAAAAGSVSLARSMKEEEPLNLDADAEHQQVRREEQTTEGISKTNKSRSRLEATTATVRQGTHLKMHRLTPRRAALPSELGDHLARVRSSGLGPIWKPLVRAGEEPSLMSSEIRAFWSFNEEVKSQLEQLKPTFVQL